MFRAGRQVTSPRTIEQLVALLSVATSLGAARIYFLCSGAECVSKPLNVVRRRHHGKRNTEGIKMTSAAPDFVCLSHPKLEEVVSALGFGGTLYRHRV
jgi:hypothetical protein